MNDLGQQRWRLKMFFMYCAFLVGIFVIHLIDIKIWGFSLHGICLIKSLFGIECPVCGVTRSVLSMFHFNFPLSFQYHPLGPFVFLLLMLSLVYFLLAIILRDKIKIQWHTETKIFSVVDFALNTFLLCFWIVKIML